MPNVEMSVTGVCGFVPKLPPYQTGNQVRILLVNAGPAPQGGAHGGHGHEVHVPVLTCETRFVDSGTDPNGMPLREADLIVGSESIFFLGDQDLSLVGAGSNSLSFVYGSGGVGCHAGDRANCEWLARVATISGAPARVRPDCLTTTSPVDPDIAARCALTEGSLETQSLAVDSVNNSVVHWEFKRLDPHNPDPLPGHTQALSERMLYKVALTGNAVDFRTALMNGRNAASDTFRTVFPPGVRERYVRVREDGAGKVTARVLNVPLSDLLGLRPPAPAGWRGVDHHFELFYRPLQVIGSPRVPWPLAHRCPGAGGPGTGNPQCPGAEYDDDSNA